MKRKIITKFLSTTLVATSIFSNSLTLPASADYKRFLALSSTQYSTFKEKLNKKDNKQYLLNLLDSFENNVDFTGIENANKLSNFFKNNVYKSEKSKEIKYVLKSFEDYIKTIFPLFNKNNNSLIQFLKICINNNDSISLADALYVSKDEYNQIMNDQFSKAIECFKKSNPTFNTNDGDTLKFNNITVQLPFDRSANFDQINISTKGMRHIIVGDEVKDKNFNNKQFNIGHTKYSENGMKLVAEYRKKKLLNVTGDPTLTNAFEKAVGFKPDEYIKSSEKFDNTEFGQMTYHPLNDSAITIKGVFPKTWEWSDIRTAISKVISNENCIYTSVEGNKNEDTAYFYDLSGNIPLLLVINPTNKRLVTAMPMSYDEFKKHITNNIKSLASNSNKALRITKSLKVRKKNLTLLDQAVINKITDESKKTDSKIKIEEKDDFITIS